MSFTREVRYHVIKLKTGNPVDCVVVEKDWPEYEIVWQMLKDRVDGTPSLIDKLAGLTKECRIAKHNEQMTHEANKLMAKQLIALQDKCTMLEARINQLPEYTKGYTIR